MTLAADTSVTPASGPATGGAPKPAFDDVMLAMDIVDTLRHQALIVERELGADDREAALMARLREIYRAQGIEVPDEILRDGVRALEEKRFVYEPKHRGPQVALARAYINRDRWLAPLGVVLGAAAFLGAAWEFGFEQPRARRIETLRIEREVTLPAALEKARNEALALAETSEARRRVETAYQDGALAAGDGDLDEARKAAADLDQLKDDLAKDLAIRVVSRPGEYSGIFRIPDAAPDGRNYYLIVEAVDARGRAHTLEIESEEDQKTARVARWGVRVPEGEFNRIAADKRDDQIIQNAVVGAKPKGALAPVYDVPTAGGEILEW